MSKAKEALKVLSEKADSWSVFINGKDVGIVETNYEYASKYWEKVAAAKKASIKLIKR